MKGQFYSISAFILAMFFWFFDSSVHYFVYDEPVFEFVPGDFNELWMRSTIVLLIILFGVYVDFSTSKLLKKEKQLEAIRIYSSMMSASHHILNNFINQMQLFKLEALKCNDFDRDIIELYDEAINEAKSLIHQLSEIEHITDENIWASVKPKSISSVSNKTISNILKTD